MTPNKEESMNIEEQWEKELTKIFKDWVDKIKKDGFASEGHSLAEDGVMPFITVDVMRLMILEKLVNELIQSLLDQQRQEHLSELRSIKKWTKGKNIPPTVKDELRHKLNLAISKIKGEE